jgi:hypothetical protein
MLHRYWNNYIRLTWLRGKEHGFSRRYVFLQMVRGSIRGYNTLTEI